MLQVKKLKKPTKRSGKRLEPGKKSYWKQYGVYIVNAGKHVVYVDSVNTKRK